MKPENAIWLVFAAVQLPTISMAIYYAATANKRPFLKTIFLSFGFLFAGIMAACILILYIVMHVKTAK